MAAWTDHGKGEYILTLSWVKNRFASLSEGSLSIQKFPGEQLTSHYPEQLERILVFGQRVFLGFRPLALFMAHTR